MWGLRRANHRLRDDVPIGGERMICRWCRQPMPARKGKIFCSDKCRVSSSRYEKAWAEYRQARYELETTHRRLLAERRLIDSGT